MDVQEQYYINYKKLLDGEMSKEAWEEYCESIFYYMIEDDKEVFERLKFRGN